MVSEDRSVSLFNFSSDLMDLRQKALDITKDVRAKVKDVLFYNQKKVTEAFVLEGIGTHHFYGTTGYGFNDAGREALERVYSRIFRTQRSIVRHSIVSGTHAISSVLFGNLRCGDELLCVTGEPYDTLKPVLGLDSKWAGGLSEWGVKTVVVPLKEDGYPNFEAIEKSISENTKMVFIQRSCGYNWRPSFSVKLIGEVIELVKGVKEDVIVMIDNCYGEMVDVVEPTDLGADVMAGSLIKNMGGGIAPTGGYITGREDVVERSSVALTCAGVGADEGATLGYNRLLFQGTFMAPSVVAEALEGVIWASCFLELLGFDTHPKWNEERADIIQGIKLGSVKAQKVFCRGIQKVGPIDSFATPVPDSLPGYRDPIIMAGGTFIQGSSIELSCDGPLREPYAVYLQGGLTFEHVQLGVMSAVEEMRREGFCGVRKL